MSDQTFGQSTTPPQSAPQAESFDIRTMPEAFFPKAPPAAPFPWGLVLGLSAVLLLVVGAGVYFLFFYSSPSTSSTPIVSLAPESPLPPVRDTATGTAVVIPSPESSPAATPTPVVGGGQVPSVLLRASDRDHDDLTDAEEEALHTDPDRTDTDGDGYADGQELVNLYDPLAPSPAMLEKSRSMLAFENKIFGYRFLYPGVWAVPRAADPAETQVVVVTPIPEEFFTVNVLENPKRETAFEWYMHEAPAGTDPRTLSRIFLENLEGVWSMDDKRTVYFALQSGGAREWIYSLTYQSGEKRELNYTTLFQTVIQSFRVKPPQRGTPGTP